jgi:uncharacterized protein
MGHNHLRHSDFIWAIKSRDLEKIRSLIDKGVNVNYINNTCSLSALEAAVNVGSLDIANILIESKANPNIFHERSPLVIAANKGFVDIAFLLIEHGADVNADPDVDMTPLSNAVSHNCISLVEKMIAMGADVNACGDESNSALSVAVCYGHKAIYEYLAPLTSPDLQDEFVCNGFHMAAASSSIIGLEFFVSIGGDIECKDFAGSTALMTTIRLGHIYATKKLLELGACKNTQDNNGETPVSIAMEYGRPEIVDVLNCFG